MRTLQPRGTIEVTNAESYFCHAGLEAISFSPSASWLLGLGDCTMMASTKLAFGDGFPMIPN